MKLQKILALTLSLLLLVCLFVGCGSASTNNASPSVGGADYEDLSKPDGSTQSATPLNRKMIRKMWLEAETESLDTLLADVDQRVSQLAGYVEARKVYNGSIGSSRSRRYANLTIRIPVEKMDSFVTQVAGASNIVSQNETAEDVTLSYIATQSRITALETEQTRLLELLAKAETMDDLLTIEARLTDVRTELEEVTSQLRLYDNLVDYGTIYLELEEVQEYTEPEPEGFWERIGSGFVKSLQSLGVVLAELFGFLIIASPYLLLIGGIVAVILLIHRRNAKKKKKRNNPPFPT